MINIHSRRSLRDCNTLALDGSATALVAVQSLDELKYALQWARHRGLPAIPMGAGSNVVVAGDVEALVVLMRTRGVDVLRQSGSAVELRVAAGEDWHGLVRWTLDNGYFGLENLALIPGSVGASPVQNIGAYGVELSDRLLAVHAVNAVNGDAVRLSARECRLGYRNSIFKQQDAEPLIITHVDLKLAMQPEPRITYPALRAELIRLGIERPTPWQVFETVVGIRQAKLPAPEREPNAGSFFKNPVLPPTVAQPLIAAYPALPGYPQEDGSVKIPAAWLIDYCGWKGVRAGQVGVHDRHALVLVNHGSGTGREILALADSIIADVQRQFGVSLEIEPRILGTR